MKTLGALTVALLGLLLVLESGEGAKKGSNGASGVSKKPTAPGRSEQLPPPSQKSKLSAAKEIIPDDNKPLKPASQSLAGERKATLPSKRSLLEDEEDQDDDDDDEYDDDDDDELEDEDEEPMTDDEDEERGVDEEEGEEEEYDDDDEDGKEEEERPRGGRQRSKASDWHYSDKPRIPGTKGKGGVFGLMRGAAKLTSSSVSSVVGMFSPNKYVGLKELAGTWKMKQKVLEFSGEVLRCEATIEIRRDGTVATFFLGKELKSEYLFKERQWPRACIIEFEARAFKGPYDREPQPKFYKGYIKRSIVKQKQIRIEGKIYEIKGTFFWRQKQQIGRFRAVKKVSR